MSLFGEIADAGDGSWSEETTIPELEFSKSDKLRHEKEMLGLYISDHPLRGIEGALRRLVNASIVDLADRDAGIVTIGGVVSGLNRRFTRTGDQMATFTLEDMEASIEVTVFSKTLAQYGHLLADDTVVTVMGRLNKRDEGPSSFVAQKITAPSNLDHYVPEVVLALPSGFTPDKLETLKSIIAEFPGASPCKVRLAGGKTFDLGPRGFVDYEKAVGPLRVAFGSGSVTVS